MKNNRLKSLQRFAALMGVLGALIGHSIAVAQDSSLQHSIEQLRTTVGHWNVTTDLLNPDGSVAKSVNGTYEFSWVVPDRVVSGRSEIPELKQASAILFYVNETRKTGASPGSRETIRCSGALPPSPNDA